MIWVILTCLIPTIVHLINDRHGDTRKTNDLIALTVLSLALAFGLNKLFDTGYFQSLALMFGVHFACFDYLIVYTLRKNGVISPHAKILSYYGHGKIDRILVRFNPYVILCVRVLILGLSIAIFSTV